MTEDHKTLCSHTDRSAGNEGDAAGIALILHVKRKIGGFNSENGIDEVGKGSAFGLDPDRVLEPDFSQAVKKRTVLFH